MVSNSLIGQTLGHYRIIDQLGAGGMGVVYRAQDLTPGRQVALKVLSAGSSDHDEAAERFKREARTATALNHPNICTIYGFDAHDGQLYLAMELLDGDPLDRKLSGRPLEMRHMLDIATQVADALDAAHAEGILHRDVKPANIFITRRGDNSTAGLAQQAVVTAPAVAVPSTSKLTPPGNSSTAAKPVDTPPAAAKPAAPAPAPGPAPVVACEAEATQRLVVARAKVANNLNDQALTDLRQLIVDYPGSRAGAEASLLAATLHEKVGHIDDAMAALVEFESRFAGDPGMNCHLDAAQVLEDLGGRFPGNPMDVWFRLGDIYERRLNHPVKARDASAKVPQGSARYAEAQRRLTRK